MPSAAPRTSKTSCGLSLFNTVCGTVCALMWPLRLCKCNVCVAAVTDHARVCDMVAAMTHMFHGNLANGLRLVVSACCCAVAVPAC